MAYFPLLLKVNDKKILLIGGGAVALFKYKKIIEYNPKQLTVVSLDFSSEFYQNTPRFVQLIQKPYTDDDLKNYDVVVVAVNDLELQQKIYNTCKELNILCNCVDEIDRCDFIFPSTIKRGDIVIAISTSGKVPGFSVSLKEFIDSIIPENIENKLEEFSLLRASLPKGKERMQLIRERSQNYFNKFMSEVRK